MQKHKMLNSVMKTLVPGREGVALKKKLTRAAKFKDFVLR